MNDILEISFNKKLSHIGSCMTMFPILEKIYKEKQKDDLVILSAGHAGLAQYVLIEKENNLIKAENLVDEMGVHPVRNPENGIYVSSGSLGSAVLVAVGLALAKKTRNIYCVLSDGECAEGNVWEALAFCKNNNLKNIIIHVNINGYSAYDEVDRDYLEQRLKSFFPDVVIHQTKNPEYLGGLNAHYHILKSKEEINNIF